MDNNRGLFGYVTDAVGGFLKHPSGIFRPSIVKGHFHENKFGDLQKLFFNELLLQDFQRTFFQIILPGQTAGLVKAIPVMENGVNECHVRFYKDGTIGCELEVSRWHFNHWVGPRFRDFSVLESILESPVTKKVMEYSDKIKALFDEKK